MHDFKENELFADIVEKSTGAYLYLKKIENDNVNFYATYINQSFENLFHISEDELKGVLLSTLLEEMSFNKENLIDLMILVEKNGRTYREIIYSYKYRKYFNLSVFKVFDKNICCMFLDMSDYKDKKEKINLLNQKVAESENELRHQIDVLTAVQEQLVRKERVYKHISDSSNDGFRYVNHKTGFTVSSQKWRELFGFQNCEENSEQFFEQIYEEDKNHFLKNYSKFLSSKEKKFTIDYRLKKGKKWLNHTSVLTYATDGTCAEEIHFCRDITELKLKQLELEYMAYFDTKTNTYNRSYFMVFLSSALQRAMIKSKLVQLMYIDIINFKKINDIAGFLMGDELIFKFAKLLLKYESQNIKIGRLCNDEFVIAIYDSENEITAEQLYKGIIKQLEKPIVLSNGLEFNISVSVGVAKYPEGGTAADELIKCADIAMCKVKDIGKNSIMVFEGEMLEEFMQNIGFEYRLKNAVNNGEFYLHFQPQYDSSTLKLRGVEALVRWKDGEYGNVSPNKFIPIAEKTGCIIEIGTWVIKEALKIYAEWKHHQRFKGIISINISAIQLKDKNFINILTHYVNKYNLESTDVEIEITESIFIGNSNLIGRVLGELRGRGFKISLDDFGTGYSSLSYLKDIPIDTLKIDKSFVDSMIVDYSTSIITSTVIQMVKKLGLETIAEGVENAQQYEYLRSINCDNIQGYYLGRPMGKNEILNLILEESKKK